MAKIFVPKPPLSAMGTDRPVSTLLRNQILHLQEAEFRLPLAMQTNIYVNAIKTEGEAADYIQKVTKALHSAHGIEPHGHAPKVAVVPRKRPVRGPDLAAVAEKRPKKKSRKSGKVTSRAKRTS